MFGSIDDFDVSEWQDQCDAIENANNVIVGGYLLAIIGDAVYVECQEIDKIAKIECTPGTASTKLLCIKMDIETGINSISRILGLSEDELPEAMVAYDARRRLGVQFEVGCITTEKVLGHVNTLGEAMAMCYRNKQHCYILDKHAGRGKVRRWEFNNGHMVAGPTRP